MRIYIAGKITGNPNYKEQFAAAEERLSKLGYTVVNPVMEEGYPYRYYINVGLRKLGHCDAIYLLRNWRRSKGARLERKYAKTVGMKIIKEQRKQKERAR